MNKICQPSRVLFFPPCSPEGESVEYNMWKANSRTGLNLSLSDYYWFYNQVRNGGPWDYKQINGNYADFGNFNYGATGYAMGIPESVLLRAAGWAQTRAGTSLKSNGDWMSDAPYGDDPIDQAFVKNGISYAKQKGY